MSTMTAPSYAFTADDARLLLPGERVLALREEWPGCPDPDGPRRVECTLQRSDVKVGKNLDGSFVVVSVSSERLDGTTKTGKNFTRWSTRSITSVTGRPGQPWLVKTRQPKFGWMTQHQFSDRGTGAFGRAQHYVDALLPAPVSMWDHYPLLPQYIDRDFSDANRDWFSRNPAGWGPGGLRRCFVGARNAHDLTRSIFGVRRHSFDLVAATARTDLVRLSLAWQFRGLVPDRTLIEMMNQEPSQSGPTPPLLRDHLRALDEPSRLALATAGTANQYTIARISTFRPVKRLPSVTGWEGLYHLLGERAQKRSGGRRRM